MKRLLPLLLLASCSPAPEPAPADPAQARLHDEARRLCEQMEAAEPAVRDRAQAALREFSWCNPEARRAVESEAPVCRSGEGQAKIKAAIRRLRLLDPPDGYYWLQLAPSGVEGVFKAVATSADPLRRPKEMHVLVDLSTGATIFMPGEGETPAPAGTGAQEWSLDPRLSGSTREKYQALLHDIGSTRSALIKSVSREDTGLRGDRLNVVAGGSRVVAWEDYPRLSATGLRKAAAPLHVAAWQGLHDTVWRTVPAPPLDEWWEAKASEEFVTLWDGSSGKGAVYSFQLDAWKKVNLSGDSEFSELTRAAGRCLVSVGYESVAAYTNREAAWCVLPIHASPLFPYKVELTEGALVAVATVWRSDAGGDRREIKGVPKDWRLEVLVIDLTGP